MGTVTINAVVYTIYEANLQAAKDYLNGELGVGPDAWNVSADDTKKSRALVAAKRYLDSLMWQGAKTVSTQTDAWPRSGVLNPDGTTVDSSTVPAVILSAEAELAAMLMVDTTILSAMNSGSNVRRVMAKGVGVEFFNATNVLGRSTPLPIIIQRLVGQYLSAAVSTAAAARAFNSNDEDGSDQDSCIDSAFNDEAIIDRVGPFG